MFGLPFVRFAPCLAAGMLTAYFCGGVVSTIVFVCAAAFAVFCEVKRESLPDGLKNSDTFKQTRLSKTLDMSLCAAGLALGAALMFGYVNLYYKPIAEFSGKTVKAEIYVSEMTELMGSGEEIIAKINLGGRIAKARIICNERLEQGDTAAAVITFGVHDERTFLYDMANGVFLSGEAEQLERLSSASVGFDVLGTVREKLAQQLSRNLSGREEQLALSMLFGMDEGLSASMYEKLRIAGAAHYTAVSGAHFSVLAAVVLGMLSEKQRRTKLLVSLLFAPAAVMFFGAGASVLRASVMFFIYSLAPLFMRRADTLNTICAAVTAVCIMSPGTVLDAGFDMSVLGIFGAGVVGTAMAKKLCELLPPKMKFLSGAVTAFSVSVCAVVCTAPLSAALFKGVSLSGALVSLVLAPLMTISMMFAILLGITGMKLLALPVGIAMRLAVWVLDFFGGIRGMWLPLDFEGAWVIAALFAVLCVLAAFGSVKIAKISANGMAALMLFSLIMPVYKRYERSEVRFVGNSDSGAAVVINKNDAAVFISGGGGALAEGIAKCLRESGAQRVVCVAAEEADFTGALAIKELSEVITIERVYTNALAAKIVGVPDARIAPENCTLTASGITIAGAAVSEGDVNADIAVYAGRSTKFPESSAKAAVYFFASDVELPPNAYNARYDDISIRLPTGGLEIVVGSQ